MDDKLKPCPFCGADEENGVHVDFVVSVDEFDNYVHYAVICEICGAEIGYFKRKEKAIEVWNRRVK